MRQTDPDQEIYPIGVVSKLTGLPQRYLRALEERGVLRPARSEKNRRLYSENEVKKLQDISYLAAFRKVNIAGIKEVLSILEILSPREREKVRAYFKRELSRALQGVETSVEGLAANLEEIAENPEEAVAQAGMPASEATEATLLGLEEDDPQEVGA